MYRANEHVVLRVSGTLATGSIRDETSRSVYATLDQASLAICFCTLRLERTTFLLPTKSCLLIDRVLRKSEKERGFYNWVHP
jgi:hypothetical protein